MAFIDKSIINSAKRHLKKNDKIMATLIKNSEPVSANKSSFPHFHSLVRAIINQQLSVKAGRTIEKRVLSLHGGRYFKANKIISLKESALRKCGISYKKIKYIHTLASAVNNGDLNFKKLAKQDDQTISSVLTEYPGIGQWSADMFLITSLQRQDVFPIGDLVLRKSMQHYYRLPENTKHEKYILIADSWKPYRTLASLYLWKNSP